MNWINNYVWFSKKATMSVLPFLAGIASNTFLPEYANWLVIPAMLIFGWSRDTRRAGSYFMHRNKD